MVAVWLIAGDRFEKAVSFFMRGHERIQFRQLELWICFL